MHRQCIAEFLEVRLTESVKRLCRMTADQSVCQHSRKNKGMVFLQDYYELAAVLLWHNPRTMFEIGTYMGDTSQFALEVIPGLTVVSVSLLQNPKIDIEIITRELVGCRISQKNRCRYTQLIADSHSLDSEGLVQEFGKFDFVFIDGDHTQIGVEQDTELAKGILSQGGMLCWHDVNISKTKSFRGPRDMLVESKLNVVAVRDNYSGGIAVWSERIHQRLTGDKATSGNVAR